MNREDQQRLAEHFLQLHKQPPILLLPNAWDVCSARLFEVEGFDAVGTTSAGIAATLGFADGQQIELDDTIDAVRRIAECVRVPVSADIEAGYSHSASGAADAARAAIGAGAVGVNLEDGTGDESKPLYDLSAQKERISAVRAMSRSEGIGLVLNARIDVHLVSGDASTASVRQTVERANAYVDAGADCVFVVSPLDRPGLLDREVLRHLVAEIDAPLNVLGGAVILPLGELEEIGVARVSLGPGPMRAALALLRRIATELKETGTYRTITADTIPYAEVNSWFADRPNRGSLG